MPKVIPDPSACEGTEPSPELAYVLGSVLHMAFSPDTRGVSTVIVGFIGRDSRAQEDEAIYPKPHSKGKAESPWCYSGLVTIGPAQKRSVICPRSHSWGSDPVHSQAICFLTRKWTQA